MCERLGLAAFEPDGKGRRPSNAAAQARVKKALAAHDAKAAKQKTVVAVYEYWDATGELLYVKDFEPKDLGSTRPTARLASKARPKSCIACRN